MALFRLGRSDESIDALSEALDLAIRNRRQRDVGYAATALSGAVWAARDNWRLALSYRPLAEGGTHGDPDLASRWNENLCAFRKAQGRYDEALAQCRTALEQILQVHGPVSSSAAGTRKNIAYILDDLGRHEEAEAEARAALSIWLETLGPDHPYIARAHHVVGQNLLGQGRFREAEAEYRAAIEIGAAAHGPDHFEVVGAHGDLALALYYQSRYDEAIDELRAVLELRLQKYGPDHPIMALTRSNLGAMFEAKGDDAAAEAEFRAALEVRLATHGPNHLDVFLARSNLGNSMRLQGEYEQAEAYLSEALAVGEKLFPPFQLVHARCSLAQTLLALGRLDEALPQAEQAWALTDQRASHPADEAERAFVLARLLWSIDSKTRDRPRALELAREAEAKYRTLGDEKANETAEVQRWLAEREPGSGSE
jgi:tetratricopeptide (TPR) repeat protein